REMARVLTRVFVPTRARRLGQSRGEFRLDQRCALRARAAFSDWARPELVSATAMSSRWMPRSLRRLASSSNRADSAFRRLRAAFALAIQRRTAANGLAGVAAVTDRSPGSERAIIVSRHVVLPKGRIGEDSAQNRAPMFRTLRA